MTPTNERSRSLTDRPECWPSLLLESWEETRATLHMWAQIVGKVRLALTPLVNHWWNVPLYVSARGLTTSSMSYEKMVFELEFDFVDHQLVLKKSNGSVEETCARATHRRRFLSKTSWTCCGRKAST